MVKPIDLLGMGLTRSERYVSERNMWEITIQPPAWSGLTKAGTIFLTEDQHRRYCQWLKDGTLIQDVFPELSLSQREILISGINEDS